MADPNRPRHYEEEFKRQIVQLYENGKPSSQIRAEYGIPRSTLRRWVQGIRNSGSTKAADNRTPEENGLIDRIAETRQAAGDGGRRFRTSGAGIRTKAGVIRSDAGRCPISAQCGILGVARSTCHWMLEHPEAERADPYEKDVERVWRDSGKVYGARKIKHALGHEGVTLSRRRVNRIMKRNGMAGRGL